jgi:hypothetical protein
LLVIVVIHNTKRSYHCSEHSSSNRNKTDDVKDSFYEELERL